MSAGVKIYNHKGQVSVDSNYQNIACHRILSANGDIISQFTAQDAAFNVHVHELLHASALGISNRVSRMHQRQSAPNRLYGAVRGDKSLGHIYGKEYIFGTPALDNPSVSAGLRIYRTGTQDLVFDSRLPYLKIVGQVHHGMHLDPARQYGILTTTPVNFKRQGWHRQGRGYVYDNWYYDDFQAFCIDNNRILEYRMVRQETHFKTTLYFEANMNLVYESAKPPYLVDLTNI